mgnify:FL=1
MVATPQTFVATTIGRVAIPKLADTLVRTGADKFIKLYGQKAFEAILGTAIGARAYSQTEEYISEYINHIDNGGDENSFVPKGSMPTATRSEQMDAMMAVPDTTAFADDIDEGKEEETTGTELSTEVKEEPPKLPEEDPDPGYPYDPETELYKRTIEETITRQTKENEKQTKKVLEKKEDTTPGIGHNQPPSAIEEQTKELLGENLTVDTVLDKNLLDELLVMRDGIKGFNKRMSSSFAPLPNSTKSKMIIELQDKLFNKYNLDKYPEGKTPENTTKEEQEALKKKFNTQLQGIEYIVSAAYDAIPREGTSAVDKVTKQDIANGYSVFTLDNEGLPIAGAKIKKFIKSHGGDPKGPDPKEERAPAVYITEMGSITTNATSKLLNKIIEIAKENNINYVVAEDLTSKEALEAFKKRGFQSTLRKEYTKFKGRKIRRPTNNRLILQKNLVLKINKN